MACRHPNDNTRQYVCGHCGARTSTRCRCGGVDRTRLACGARGWRSGVWCATVWRAVVPLGAPRIPAGALGSAVCAYAHLGSISAPVVSCGFSSDIIHLSGRSLAHVASGALRGAGHGACRTAVSWWEGRGGPPRRTLCRDNGDVGAHARSRMPVGWGRHPASGPMWVRCGCPRRGAAVRGASGAMWVRRAGVRIMSARS